MKKLFLLLALLGMVAVGCSKDDTDKGGNTNVDIPADTRETIKFQDANTKLICTLHWDTNNDGELSYKEAAAVTDLGKAFKGSSILAFTELMYFTGLTDIADYAFSGCESLVKIAISEHITSIGYEAFDGCDNLTGVYISDIAAWCNISFDSLSSNPLSKPWGYNGGNLYLNNELVTELVIPNSVTAIGDWAFAYCNSLISVTIPDSITAIGEGAFYYCRNLTSITIPDSITAIGEGAFSGCSNLPVIDNIRYADTYLVEAVNTTLATYSIKEGTKFIGFEAFQYCDITSITIPDSVTTIGGYAFYKCDGLTSVTIPDSVTTIGNFAFSKCNSLISVTIPDSVTTIEYCAFNECESLESVTIGNRVTLIEGYAFCDCDRLISVYCKAITPPAGDDMGYFFDYYDTPKIYVPTASVEAYKSASGWWEYADDIVGYDF